MEYLTQLIGKIVVDTTGERFGKPAEVVVTPGEPFPLVAAYQVKTKDGALFVPWDKLDVGADSREFSLRHSVTEIRPYQIQASDFSLVRDVLDKQIVDVHDYRVVRVNDIRLQMLPSGQLALLGVDPGVKSCCGGWACRIWSGRSAAPCIWAAMPTRSSAGTMSSHCRPILPGSR